ncbi:hypothetical protein SKAU_G00411810 [Synaphobranchus kaupii]|uniref:Inner centromere protein n=1 Tax=Synaphobranchus kaupii TaxID=118154 RepID=A0A9Q1E7Z6_SYNKA|nr:hypothetical protein SKAU_G00411810 [Synaphobranchus kaupii]
MNALCWSLDWIGPQNYIRTFVYSSVDWTAASDRDIPHFSDWSFGYDHSRYSETTSMNSLLASTRSLLEMFDGKLQEFGDNVDSTHMVWLEEIQQEANRMFSSDFNAEPELMPKTPSQKKRSRRKRVSVGHNENRSTRRFSKGTRSNLRISSVQTLKLISEDNNDLGASSLQEETAEEKLPKRNTRRNNRQKQTEEMEPGEIKPPKCSMQKAIHMICLEQREDGPDDLQSNSLGQAQACLDAQNLEGMSQQEAPVVQVTSFSPQPHSMICTPPEKLVAVVRISAAERVSADRQEKLSPQCRTASKLAIARPLEIPALAPSPRRSSVRHSLTLRRSLAGLRHSMTQESVRRASRRSFLKKKARMSSSTCSSSTSGVCVEMDEEKAEDGMHNVLAEHPAEIETDLVDQKVGEDITITDPSDSEGIRRVTRSMAQTIPSPPQRTKKDHILGCESSTSLESDDIGRKPAVVSSSLRSCPSVKRRAVEAAEELSSPRKKLTPPKKSHSVIRPNMKSFLHTVQKNQLLMMTPGSLSRSTVVKSFIKHNTPLRVDLKPGGGLVERERLRLEALKKKQEQEIERKKKLEEEKRRKQEEMKRKRDVRLRKVVEARVKEEQREEEKKKKIEQKLAHMEEKNDKLRVERLAEEKAKKKVATKRQEELEQRKRQDEETRRRKILQAEEEKKQQELLMKRRAEDELERARRLAEARRALELKKEQEKEREKDQEREREKEQEREREKDQEREQERERELLRQQQAAAEREREKALTLQRELAKAAREKEQREAEERKRREEMQRQVEQERAAAVAAAARNVVTVEIQKSTMMTPVGKAAGLNVTIDVERSSPQSYEITPKGGSKTLLVSANPEDYGMDQNSDDSTDDESAPRKPIPSWAEGQQLQQAMLNQYFNPVDVDSYFGEIEEPKLEQIFNKSKPRYFKRTSSAVWQSPPRVGHTAF